MGRVVWTIVVIYNLWYFTRRYPVDARALHAGYRRGCRAAPCASKPLPLCHDLWIAMRMKHLAKISPRDRPALSCIHPLARARQRRVGHARMSVQGGDRYVDLHPTLALAHCLRPPTCKTHAFPHPPISIECLQDQTRPQTCRPKWDRPVLRVKMWLQIERGVRI